MLANDRVLAGALVALFACTAVSGCAKSAARADFREPRSLPTSVTSGAHLDFHIVVDQFGYRPADPKVAVIRDPRAGFDSADRYIPGPVLQLRRVTDGAVVASGPAVAWRSGAVERSSGDRGWWFDFSKVTEPGDYFVFDAHNLARSATFAIRADVYRAVLQAAQRMYFYQRSGFAKVTPFAPQCWTDAPAYVGPGQDTEAHDVTDRTNRSKVRDLSGGWFDAGDTNKYVTFAAQPVHQLLSAYERHPTAFGDDLRIPESDNGIPDVLDEVDWELRWLEKMQFPDGRAALKVGALVDTRGGRPSEDRNPRFYVPACSSATIAVAGAFAHAAVVFRTVGPLRSRASALESRARAAWTSFAGQPLQTHCDSGVVKSGIADWSESEQRSEAVVAAVYLFALTRDAAYADFIRANYRQTRPYRDAGWSRYDPQQGEALLFYSSIPDAAADLRAAILADKRRDAGSAPQVYGFRVDDDLYRAFLPDAQFHWGSSAPRANTGNSNMQMIAYGLASSADGGRDYRQRALEMLHYFHGVNPFGMVYLTNMYAQGATRSANEIYHTWFWHGSEWSDALRSTCGPAPGYVPGGPNAAAVENGVPADLRPPAGQPPQKAYRDWNAPWPQSSWAVTEPGIYYQAAYIALLSNFVD